MEVAQHLMRLETPNMNGNACQPEAKSSKIESKSGALGVCEAVKIATPKESCAPYAVARKK